MKIRTLNILAAALLALNLAAPGVTRAEIMDIPVELQSDEAMELAARADALDSEATEVAHQGSEQDDAATKRARRTQVMQLLQERLDATRQATRLLAERFRELYGKHDFDRRPFIQMHAAIRYNVGHQSALKDVRKEVVREIQEGGPAADALIELTIGTLLRSNGDFEQIVWNYKNMVDRVKRDRAKAEKAD